MDQFFESVIGFPNTYSLNRDLSSGQSYPMFESVKTFYNFSNSNDSSLLDTNLPVNMMWKTSHTLIKVQKKSFFIQACHSGKLKLAYTSPNVMSTSPKNIW